MKVCPLCGTLTAHDAGKELAMSPNNVSDSQPQSRFDISSMSRPQRLATWEFVSLILMLSVVSTSLINLILNGEISWSEFPLAVCLIIFSYISSFAFLDKRKEVQLFSAFASASVCILVLDSLTKSAGWALTLAIPLLFFANMIVIGLIVVFRNAKQRGINLIAYAFLAAALLCLCIELTVDLYVFEHIKLVWSLIVASSILPVVATLLFMHFRMKKGQSLNKTFHI